MLDNLYREANRRDPYEDFDAQMIRLNRYVKWTGALLIVAALAVALLVLWPPVHAAVVVDPCANESSMSWAEWILKGCWLY